MPFRSVLKRVRDRPSVWIIVTIVSRGIVSVWLVGVEVGQRWNSIRVMADTADVWGGVIRCRRCPR